MGYKVIYFNSSTGQALNTRPGQIIPWEKLFFPKGCGRTPGGVPVKPLPKPTPKPPRPIDSSSETTNVKPVQSGQGIN